MVFGTYMKYLKTLQINLRIVDVETGQILKAVQKRAPFTSIGEALKMTGQAALEL
jgi:curli biogenesis system outer membrane secretion channel CsgG